MVWDSWYLILRRIKKKLYKVSEIMRNFPFNCISEISGTEEKWLDLHPIRRLRKALNINEPIFEQTLIFQIFCVNIAIFHWFKHCSNHLFSSKVVEFVLYSKNEISITFVKTKTKFMLILSNLQENAYRFIKFQKHSCYFQNSNSILTNSSYIIQM